MDKEGGKVDEKKKEDPIKKLEKEFRDFQKQWGEQWEKFLTNDFSHLVADVGAINMRIGTLIDQNVKEHAEMYECIEIMLKNEGEMKQTMDLGLEASTRIIGLLNQGR